MSLLKRVMEVLMVLISVLTWRRVTLLVIVGLCQRNIYIMMKGEMISHWLQLKTNGILINGMTLLMMRRMMMITFQDYIEMGNCMRSSSLEKLSLGHG